MRGKLTSNSQCFLADFRSLLRYINQYQTLLDEEDKYPSRQEREVYAKAILTAAGDRPDWDSTPPEDAFVRHVQLASPEFVDAYFRDEGLTMDLSREGSATNIGQTGSGTMTVGHPFNYGKWVGMGIARKVTNDYSLYA